MQLKDATDPDCPVPTCWFPNLTIILLIILINVILVIIINVILIVVFVIINVFLIINVILIIMNITRWNQGLVLLTFYNLSFFF